MPPTVLVTGGAGFIGSNFIHYLLRSDAGVNVINLDRLTYAGRPENLQDLPDPSRHTFVEGDICDRPLVDRLMSEYQVDTIVHFAAETHVDRSILGPEVFVRTNILGTFTLLEAARQAWLVQKTVQTTAPFRFHHVSTDEVFGSLAPGAPAWREDTPYDPRSPYSASKASSDHLVRAYFHTYGLPATITNCSNNYGPRQFPEKLIPLMIFNALEGRPLPVYGDGQQVRDWLYVEDHCEAIWQIVTRGQTGETYNIGGGNQPANLTIVETLCEILDELRSDSPHAPHKNLIRFVADRPGHDRRYAMDIARISTELGWQPRESLTTGLLKTTRWYLEHGDWVAAIRQGSELKTWMEKNYTQRGDTK
jgi:dTDP-glucose 4,6-dehydratase